MKKILILLLLPILSFSQALVPSSVHIYLDQYMSETSWDIKDTTGNVVAADGPYYNAVNYQSMIIPVMLPEGNLTFTIYDSYGDGLAGGLWGGLDGSYYVKQCNDTLVFGDVPNFGFDTAHAFGSDACPPVMGCMDPAYVEFNHLADTDDGSCNTLKVFGCTDNSMFNYDPLANTMALIPNCDYVLTLTDLIGDGWQASSLEVKQDTNTWVFTIDTALYSQDFIINLKSPMPVEFKFFITQQAALTASHCGFKLTNPLGDITIEVLAPFIQPLFKYKTSTYCGNLCIEKVFGCTSSTAINYNPLANTDDNSCYYNPGCTSPTYVEYDASYDYDDGSCNTLVVLGCMDPLAFNYNALANTEITGSCISVVTGCMQPLAFNYNPNANVSDTCVAVLYGCMTPGALNYNPLANTDDNSCIAVVYGCTDTTMWNYSPSANVDNEECIPYAYGCTDATMWNYNQQANTDNGSCVEYAYGCVDADAFNYDPLANTDNGTCVPVISGCTNPMALNYNTLANVDDFSCILPIYGCLDSLAFNYDALANVDNESCLPIVLGCTDPIALNYCDSCNTDDFSCVLPIYGCTDGTMFNYNPLANVDNSSCVPYIYGCTDPSMLNYDPLSNTENFTCIEFVYGCMDAEAFNYDSTANTENNSCVTIIEGCMDPDAYNYSLEANVSNNSCNYDAGCITGPGNPYWLNDPCYAWVISVDDYCCNNEWDTVCQATYNYCDGTYIGDIPTRLTSEEVIMVYPNPASGTININKNVDINLLNYIGDIVISKQNTNILDVSKISSGMYMLQITYDNKTINKQIIKK